MNQYLISIIFFLFISQYYSQAENKIDDFIPVARITDLLLNPGKKFDFDGKIYEYPDTRLIYWAGGNPFHHHQDFDKI